MRTALIRHRAQVRRQTMVVQSTGTADTMPEPLLYAWLIEANRAGEDASAERAAAEILRRKGVRA